MPKPRKGETRKNFLKRCIPDLIRNEGRPQNQAVAICSSMFKKEKSEAPNYRLSLADSKCSNCNFARPGLYCILFDFYFDIGYVCDAWQSVPSKEVNMADISFDVALEGAEEMSQQLDGLTEKADNLSESVEKVDTELDVFISKYGSTGNKNTVGTGSVDTEKDMHLDSGVMEDLKSPFTGMATSFSELESMRQVAISADVVRELSDVFAGLAKNIMVSDVENKQAALKTLAKEFTRRVDSALNTKERTAIVKEQLYYKEIEKDDTLAKGEDFKGGCSICGFGEKDLLKSLETCPFCWNEVSNG